MNAEHKAQIIATLKRECGSSAAVSEFSNNLKSLSPIDLSDDELLEKAATSGALLTLLTYQQLGLLPKIVELIKDLKKAKE